MNIIKKKTIAIFLILLGVIWSIGILAIAGSFLPLGAVFGGVTFGVLSDILALGYLILFSHDPVEQSAETNSVSAICTVLYTLIALGVNSVMTFAGFGRFCLLTLFVNAAMAAVFVVIVMMANNDAKRVSRQIEQGESRRIPIRLVTEKMAELLSMADDADIRKELYRLKEMMDYNTGTANNLTMEKGQRLLERLEAVRGSLQRHTDKAEALNLIREAGMIWKSR